MGPAGCIFGFKYGYSGYLCLCQISEGCTQIKPKLKLSHFKPWVKLQRHVQDVSDVFLLLADILVLFVCILWRILLEVCRNAPPRHSHIQWQIEKTSEEPMNRSIAIRPDGEVGHRSSPNDVWWDLNACAQRCYIMITLIAPLPKLPVCTRCDQPAPQTYCGSVYLCCRRWRRWTVCPPKRRAK